MHGLADEKLEGPVGGFEIVALKFHFLYPFEQVAAGLFGEAIGETLLLQLIDHVAASGEIADEHALPITDELGRDVFVGGGIFHYGADVNSAFMREGALADVGLVRCASADWPVRRCSGTRK